MLGDSDLQPRLQYPRRWATADKHGHAEAGSIYWRSSERGYATPPLANVATLYLVQRGRSGLFTGVPMVFMLISTFIALIGNLLSFYRGRQHLLLVVGSMLLLVAVGIVIEGLRAFLRRDRHADDVITFGSGE